MAVKTPSDATTKNDQPVKKKSNLALILGLVGCGGLLLLTCCAAGGGGGAFWYFNKSAPTRPEVGGQADDQKKPDGAKGAAAGSKLKKAYEQIQIDDHITK